MTGTLLLERADAPGTGFVHDAARARQRFSPASTFKILHTLIAVDAGVLSGPDERFAWDGVVRAMPEWNRDQTLRTAFRVSCVWCYQQIAGRIAPDVYRSAIAAVGYGVLAQPFDRTRFWIDGSLQISAEEQIAFLRALVMGRLPFSPHGRAVLRTIMEQPAEGAARLFAKTGLSGGPMPVGWYVGYVEAPSGTWLFALNLDCSSAAAIALRKPLVIDALKAKAILR